MRTSGILLPISSLPSRHGIGTLGAEARRFADFLKAAGQSYWQILPVGPTSYGDSPYQSFSSFAGNSYFIDLEILIEQGLLYESELCDADFGTDPDRVDYAALYTARKRALRLAGGRFDKTKKEYVEFCRENRLWLDDFALFMALKEDHGGRAWQEWEKPVKFREPAAMDAARNRLAAEIDQYKIEQFLFFEQWTALKTYVNGLGIGIIGDLPIYVAADAADVWAEPENFQLGPDLAPTRVAGCPPDAFSDDGQRWGNPLYDWDKMKADGYDWWCRRMRHVSRLFDVVRIDHFRAFAEYFSIPATDKTARNGKWVEGPGIEFFRTLEAKCGKQHIIAEDLGYITKSVRKLLKETGFPGIKVLQFAFEKGAESDYLPHNHIENCVVYTGTHDNDTVIGWMMESDRETVAYATEYLRLSEAEGYNWGMIRAAWASPARLSILQMQDFLGLDNSARMNTPSTLGGNWQWRLRGECVNAWLAGIIKKQTALYSRLPKAEEDESASL